MQFGKFLKERREKLNLSLSDVGDFLGYSSQTVYFWEKGSTFPDLSVWSKYANLLNLDLEGFILSSDEKNNERCKNIPFDLNKFTNNLAFLRKSKNLTQKDLSRKLHVNHKTISSWERGISLPSLKNFISLCALYKLSFDSLYFAIDDPDGPVYKKKRNIFIPIILPLIITGGAGGTVATSVAINEVTKQNKNKPKDPTTTETLPSSESMPITPSTSEVSSSTLPLHEHTPESNWIYDETSHWHNCSGCDEKIDLGNHILNTVIVQPTFQSDGSKTVSCSVCDYESVTILPKLEHSYSETFEYDKFNHWKPCTDEGYEHLYIEKDVHHFTSTTEGTITTYTCTDCGYSYSNDASTIDDDFGFEKIETENSDNQISLSNIEDIQIYITNKDNLPVESMEIKWTIGDEEHTTRFHVGPTLKLRCYEENNFSHFILDKSSINDIFHISSPCVLTLKLFTVRTFDYGEASFEENSTNITFVD